MALNTTQNQNPARAALLNKYVSARSSLLIVVICTAVNMVMAILGNDSYFVFSAYVPYQLTFFGSLLCGKMPEYWYEGEEGYQVVSDGALLIGLAALAAVILCVYLVLWILTKKLSKPLMITSLVLFSIDTGLMFLLNGLSTDLLLDYLLHAYVIYSLANGIIAVSKINALPEEPIEVESFTDVTE